MSDDAGYMESSDASDAGVTEQGEVVGRAGSANDPDDTTRASDEAVIEALRTVYDPEIPVNIYELGLIYDLDIARDGTFNTSTGTS